MKKETQFSKSQTPLAKEKPYAGNIFTEINQWASGDLRKTAMVLDWTRGNFDMIDRKF